jgi:hypothetical protein
VRLPKTGLKKTKGFFEEYFYACLVGLFLVVAVLLKAGGMKTYDAGVLGLWVAGIGWFASQAKLYREEKAKPQMKKKPSAALATQAQNGKVQLPTGMKPMIGPQWPPKSPQPRPLPLPQPSQSSPAPGKDTNKKPAFLYERPTLPDRKPKFPANWAGTPNKKPKR